MTQFINSLNATFITFMRLFFGAFRDVTMEVDENGLPTQRNRYYT